MDLFLFIYFYFILLFLVQLLYFFWSHQSTFGVWIVMWDDKKCGKTEVETERKLLLLSKSVKYAGELF